MEDNSQNLEKIKNTILKLPALCGVYLWKNAKGETLYIGKAINIRSRLLSYFHDTSVKSRALLSHAAAVDCIVVKNEYEALLLENNLIKEYTPVYNIQLKDHKTYPLIRITREDYPRIFKTRQKINDGSLYFGPYPDVKRIDSYLKIISQLFKLRKCRSIPLRKRKEPCIYYHMHQCWAPCCGKADPLKYNRELEQVLNLLKGDIHSFVQQLTEKMQEASLKQQYETAAQYRDAIHALKIVEEEQIVQDNSEVSRDYLAYAGNQYNYRFVILPMRNGKMLQKISFRIETAANDLEVLEEFILKYYTGLPKDSLPKIVFTENIPQATTLEYFFKETQKINIQFKHPMNNRDLSLLRMALSNAALDLAHDNYREGALDELQEILNLPKLPRRIEGFDIAQLSGYFTVASLVSFWNGLPDYNNYRTFRMKSLHAGEINDFKSLSEAAARRFTRLTNEGLPLPDLLIVDGGKGQLSAVVSVLEALGIADKIAVISLAKKEEEIFVPNRSQPVILKKDSAALRLCQAVRDETHRVATSHNKKLRGGLLSLTKLENIPGIGPSRARRLLMQYGSLQAIIHQDPINVAHVAKISEEAAREVINQVKILCETKDETDSSENISLNTKHSEE